VAVAIFTNVVTSPLVQARDVAGGAVLLDTMTGDCFELNRVGAEIWRRLVEGQPLDDVAAAIASEYGVARGIVEADLLRTVDDLVRRGLASIR
jgi:hypothetical protein